MTTEEMRRGPTMAPPMNVEKGADQQDSWRQFDSSVNALSFGFVATAILISMFLLIALFERLFLRPPPPSSSAPLRRRGFSDPESNFCRKLDFPSPKMSIYAKGVSVLMPGNDMPTYIAHPAPAPVPCQPERILWPSHGHIPGGGSTSSPRSSL